MHVALLLAIFFPIIFSPLFFIFRIFYPRHLGFIGMFYAFVSLIGIIWAGLSSQWSEPAVMSVPWVSSMDINLSFITDGLSLFFGILVTVMGVLVFLYAQYYMNPKDPHLGRFYACLTFFMGAMLGTVFSSNLMLLFFFWELTGAASFLLIGYLHPEAAAWKGARMALLVTAFTSLALLAGIILLGSLTGTFEWHVLAKKGLSLKTHPEWIYPIILCFIIGIFGKSAQFPFYFWLPNAMVAPTPVSAYLHAATMVKLGVFLTARMYPLFVSHELWHFMLITFSFITLLLGGFLSLLSNDLKAILAYATVSQLGFFLGFYGIGGVEGVEYDFIHILNHAFYKGSLFMLVGIVEHATGIRDVRLLGGLWNKLPLTTLIFFIAVAAMAGIPGTTGFLSKELVLSNLVELGQSHSIGWLILGVLFVASILKVAFSIRIFYHLFLRDTQIKQKSAPLHYPSLGVQLPPLILSSAAFIFGIWPSGLEHFVSFFYVSGLHKPDPRVLQIWHGFTFELLISLMILISGTLLFLAAERTEWRWTRIVEKLNLGDQFNRFVQLFPTLCKMITRPFEPLTINQQLSFLFALFGLGLGGFLMVYAPALNLEISSFFSVKFFMILIISLLSLLVAIFKNPISKLLAYSGSGFLIAFFFIFYKAPDLAMTQVLVEVVSSLIILLLFHFLGPQMQDSEPFFSKRQKLALPLALICGLTAALITGLYHSSNKPMKEFFIANSIPYAHAKNIVNAILVDFRGLDTLGESVVLLTAMLGVVGLLTNKEVLILRSPLPKIPMNSSILHSILPLIFILMNLSSLYLLLRGHDYPGGGFIAGLVNGIAIIILGLAIPHLKNSFYLNNLGFSGLALILIAGCIPIVAGHLFLTHYVHAPDFTFFNLIAFRTPLIFDVGVYCIVLAMTSKIYFMFRQIYFNR